MTRVLITTIPIEGHVRPGVPLARCLTERGHDVVWYTGRRFEPLVVATGARFVPIKANAYFSDTNADVLRDMQDKKPGFSGLKKIVTDLLIAPLPQYASDVSHVIDSFDPEVIVANHIFMAAPLIAYRRRIASVLFSVGPLSVSSIDTAPFGTGLRPSSSFYGRIRNRLLNSLVRNLLFRGPQQLAKEVVGQLGVDVPEGFLMDWGAQLADRYLLATIPEFEYLRSDLPKAVEFVGPMLPERRPDWSVPSWWPEIAEANRRGRPVVLVTQGTANIDPSLLILPTISSLSDEDMLVIATTGGPDPEEVLPTNQRPVNLRLESFIPFLELLPHADLMVTNGGYGGVQMALACGVPLVVAGKGEDKMEVSARVAQSGAGMSLRTQRPSADRIRTAVRSVLGDPSYRTRAKELEAVYSQYDGASRAADVIVETAQRQRPGRADPAL